MMKGAHFLELATQTTLEYLARIPIFHEMIDSLCSKHWRYFMVVASFDKVFSAAVNLTIPT